MHAAFFNCGLRIELLSILNSFYSDISFTAYPNPADDVINLRFSDNLNTQKQIYLYSVTGQEAYVMLTSDAEAQIPVEDLIPGLYMIRTVFEGGSQETTNILIR